MRTKPKLRRICAFLLALVVLFTTCFADLPEGSLSFLGGIGEQIVSVLSNDEAEAATVHSTTKFSLPTAYGTASISEIGRYSEGMWFFECKSYTGSMTTVFCMNSGKSLHTADTYKYTTTNAVTYSNQSLAKAMTWWFGSTSRGCVNQGGYNNGSSYGSLTATQTHAAVQGYVWACNTSGASKETTVRQILTNYCGLSYNKAASYAKSIVNAISNTHVYGTIYYYTLSSCGKGSSSTHQTMLSWSPDGIYKTDSYSTSDNTTGKVTITIEIDKKDKTTGSLIDTAKFYVTYAGKLLKNATSVSISSGSITSATVSTSTGSYDKDTSYFTTKEGKVKFTFTVNYKTKTYTTKSYKYVVNWDEVDYWTQLELTNAGYYQNKSKAQAAANNELASGLATYRSSAINSIREKTITVTEKSAPAGHGISSTSTLSKTAKNSVSLTYEFSDPPKYGKVTVTKKEGDTSNYDTSYSPMKGAVYGVYAAETIYDTNNKTVLYKKDALIKKITTNSSGVASTGNILPVGYDYYVKEIEAPEGWKLDTTKHKFSITLDSNGNVKSATVTSTEDHEQKMYYGAVSVIKSAAKSSGYDVDDATLKNAEYTVYAGETIYDVDGTTVLFKKGAKVTTITTNSSGYGKSAKVIPAGDDSNGYKYYLQETKASKGYELDGTKYYFYVRVNSSHTVTVKDADGNTVNGTLNSKNAIKSTEDHELEPKYGRVAIVKVSSKDSSYIGEGATVKGAVYGVYAAETIYDVDGKTVLYKKGAKVTSFTTNSNGYGRSAKVIPAGDDSDGYHCYVQEITAPTGYNLSTTKYNIYVRVDSDGNVTTVDANGNDVSGTYDSLKYKTVKEEPIWGYVAINKYTQDTDGTTNLEAKAVFYVVELDAVLSATGTTSQSKAKAAIKEMSAAERAALIETITSADSGAVKDILTTNSSGYDKSVALPMGKYMLIQTVGAEGYNLEQYYFSITKDSGKTYTYDIYNTQTAAINITKTKSSKSTDGTTVYEAEEGAVFYVLDASYVSESLSTLNEKKTASARQAYVDSLNSSAVIAVLTTDSNGEASTYVSAGNTYIIYQTYGDPDCKLAEADKHTFASGETKTYYYDADNPEDHTKFSITKTMTNALGTGEEAEEGAIFAVIKASSVTKTANEIAEMTATERQVYVAELTDADSSCILATLITDSNGEAYSYWNDSDYDGDFVVIQTVGEDGYALMPAVYSADATSTGLDGSGNAVMRKITGTDSDNMDYTYYSFEYTDKMEGSTEFSITKTLSDKDGSNEQPEEGAVFAVIKSSYVTMTADEIAVMAASERAAYVTGLEESDASCILAELTTDEDGTASASWTADDYDGDFVVIQTVGEDGYELMPAMYSNQATAAGLDGSGNAVMKVETAEDESGLSYSISWKDLCEGSTDFTIVKTLSDSNGNESAEEGAVFAVIKSSYVTMTADEINVMTEDERSDYVKELEDADSSCIIATLTTSSEGDATASWSDSDYNGEFVVIQTEGEDGYTLMPAAYSADATSTGLDGSGNAVMTVTSDSKTTSYSFSYVDEFEDWAKIAVQKKYESANGTWTDEEGATFSILNAAGEEVAWVTTDSTGYGVALDASGNEAALAFGTYYVHQTGSGKGAENTSFIDDELVILTKWDREATVLYEAQNPAEDYDFTLTKLSDDTNAPVEGATYTIKASGDIYASDNSIEYPSGTTVATIITDENGQGTTKLPYGSYCIEESSSPYNFVKNTEKVYFTLDASGITVSGGKTSAATLVTETDEEGNTFTHYEVTYTTYDTPIYGTIYVTKDGQVVNGLAFEGGFTYTSTALEGAVFALYARNDITDDAGNVVWEAGEYITSATTDSTGTAQFYWDKDGDSSNGEESFAFYLGDYYVVETYAPPGYVLDKTEHDITLTWDKTPSTENEMADAGSVSDTGEAGGAAVSYESSGKYVLMTGSSLNELIKDAVSVTFTWSSPADGTTTTDVSHDGDGSVVMWNDGAGNYYISTQDIRQAVIFNGDSSYMFANCSSLKEVRFDSVDTSKACDMSYMFYMCTLLTELDLTEFDTTNVEVFDYMFCGCTSLVTIYVTEPGTTGTDTESVYHTDTWTTGVTASAVGPLTDGDDITLENFSFTRLYTADYIVEDVEENITLSASDIASITPSATSQDDDSVVWIDDNTYTMDVEITLSESCAYYCTDGTYSNTMTVTVTVLIPEEVEVEAEESPMATLALSNTPITVNIEVYKVDGNGDPLAGAVFTLYANCDIKNADGETIIKAGEAIMESETLGEAAPVLTFSGLPTDLYAVDGTYLNESSDAVYCYADGTTGSSAKGESMFYVKETTVPAGHTADGHTYYLTGALSDYDADAEDADGTITYTFTAINTELTYLTLQKAWNDGADSSTRPEFVVFKATTDGGSSYVIVMYEDKAYLFSYATSSVGYYVYNYGVVASGQLNNALCYWDTEVTTEGSGSSAVTVWSVALDNHFTLVSGSSSFTSPFTATSGYTFAENADLLKSMTINAAQTQYYYIDSEGWISSDKLVWRTTNKLKTIDESVSSTVTKYWDDSNDEMEVRPDSISVTLYQEDANGNTVVKAVRTLSEENDWTYSTADDTDSFKNGLEKIDDDGNAYTYYWTEATATFPTGYTQTAEKTWYDEDNETWYTEFTNSITVTIPVSVEKVWNDDSDAQGIRPTTIYMRLYADGVWVDVNGNAVTSSTTADTAVALTKDNEWKATLYGLPKYNSSGKEITYKFAELTYSTELIIGGKKVTPAESEFAVFTGSKTTGYLVSTSYNGAKTTVTNTHTPSGEVTVYKKVLASDISLSGGEPEVTFTLTASDGSSSEKTIVFTQDYVAANTDASGYVTASATFTNLEYGTYTLAETEVPDGWEFVSLTSVGGMVSGETVKFTISSSNVSESFEAAFENEFVTEGGVTVYKKVLASEIDWDEGDPEFTFTLTASDDTSSEKTITFTEDYVTANTDASGYVTVSATFPSLEYGTYTLAETEAPDRWTFVSLTSVGGTVSGETVTFTISKSNSSAEFEAVFVNEYNAPGSAVVYKKVRANDIDWDEGEPSFSFTLTNPDSTTTTKKVTITKLYADANTDADGYVTISATFPNLDYGTYTLEETNIPDEWEFVSLTCTDGTVDGKKATFTISKANAQQAVEATYVNEYNQPGEVTVYKKVLASSIDWTSGEPSFTFTLTASDGTSEKQTITLTEDYVTANTTADGYVTASATFTNLSYGTYTLTETEVPDGWEFVSLTSSNGTVSGGDATFTISKANASESFEATFTNKYNKPGEVTVYKKVLASDVTLYGGEPSFTFTLTASDGTAESKAIKLTQDYVTANTDASGYVTASATFTNLSYGTYTLEETDMPDGWEFVSLTSSNGVVSGEGAEFTISGSNASESFEAIFVNEYTSEGGVTVYKKILASEIDWTKGNPEFSFTLTASDGTTVTKSVSFTQDYVTANTDADGCVTASATFPSLEYGTYTLKETEAPDRWTFVSLTSSTGTVNGESVTFTISKANASESFEATFTNEYNAPGEAVVYKKVLASEIDWTKGNPEFTFTLTDPDNATTTKTITLTQDFVTANTDADGYVTASATFTELEYGEYTLEETAMPDRWSFVSLTASDGTVSGKMVTFTISKANATAAFEATYTNEYNALGEAVVYKKVLASEIDWTKGNPEFSFTLTDPDNTTTTKTITLTQDYVAANTDTNGYVTASVTFTELEYGEYTLEETNMPDNWSFVSLTASDGTVSGKSVAFTISKANATAAFEATFLNQYDKPGNLTVYKKILASDIDWTDGNPEFTFTLTASDGSSVNKTITFTESYVTANTDAEGYVTASASFTEVMYGTYTLKETKMPVGWKFVSLTSSTGTVSGESVTFVINRENASTAFEATFVDERDRSGKITIIKYGSDGKTVLSGVTFAISDEDGNLVDTQTTDENGQVVFDGLEIGTYRICETATVSGYSLLADEITATIPLVLTQEEIDAYEADGVHVDVTNASVRDGEYYFYELTYEVKDTWNLDLPSTGSTGTMPKLLLVFGFMLLASALLVSLKRGRKSR